MGKGNMKQSYWAVATTLMTTAFSSGAMAQSLLIQPSRQSFERFNIVLELTDEMAVELREMSGGEIGDFLKNRGIDLDSNSWVEIHEEGRSVDLHCFECVVRDLQSIAGDTPQPFNDKIPFR